jgi:hypothetical protein
MDPAAVAPPLLLFVLALAAYRAHAGGGPASVRIPATETLR